MFRRLRSIFKAVARVLLCAKDTQMNPSTENHVGNFDISTLALLPPQYRLTNECYPQSRLVTHGEVDPYRSPSISISSLQLDDDEYQEVSLKIKEQPGALPHVQTKTCHSTESILSDADSFVSCQEEHKNEENIDNDNEMCGVADLIRYFELLQASESYPGSGNDFLCHTITHPVETNSARVRELVALFECDASGPSRCC